MLIQGCCLWNDRMKSNRWTALEFLIGVIDDVCRIAALSIAKSTVHRQWVWNAIRRQHNITHVSRAFYAFYIFLLYSPFSPGSANCVDFHHLFDLSLYLHTRIRVDVCMMHWSGVSTFSFGVSLSVNINSNSVWVDFIIQTIKVHRLKGTVLWLSLEVEVLELHLFPAQPIQ